MPKMMENLRDRSCLLRCSLLLNARLQNWHLYFFSGTPATFLLGGGELPSAGTESSVAVGIVLDRITVVEQLEGGV